jgi:hypothetical protein
MSVTSYICQTTSKPASTFTHLFVSNDNGERETQIECQVQKDTISARQTVNQTMEFDLLHEPERSRSSLCRSIRTDKWEGGTPRHAFRWPKSLRPVLGSWADKKISLWSNKSSRGSGMGRSTHTGAQIEHPILRLVRVKWTACQANKICKFINYWDTYYCVLIRSIGKQRAYSAWCCSASNVRSI